MYSNAAIRIAADPGADDPSRQFCERLPTVRSGGRIHTFRLCAKLGRVTSYPTSRYERRPYFNLISVLLVVQNASLFAFAEVAMAKFVRLLVTLVQLAAACQRELRNRDLPLHDLDIAVESRQATPFPPQWTENEKVLHTSFSNTELDTWSSYYTHGDHVAGRNKTMAEETAKKWIANGVPSSLVEYEVFLNYPKEQALVLTWGNGSRYEAQMYEDVLEEDETTGYEGGLPAFHGYSASGKVEAEYVYVG